ncbi:MAG: hypothetical protein M3Y50_09675 [Acidobacteriota bacterium]|nr:hypothetical protein [Acidobacteriota bacterium]
MDTLIGSKNFDIQKFAESLVRDGREGVKWERRKLEWIREERAEREKSKSEAP